YREVVIDPETGRKKAYKLLREGDYVTKGDLLAQLDEALARAEYNSKTAKVTVAERERETSEAMREEMKQRWKTREALGIAASKEEVREAYLGYYKYEKEELSKKEGIQVAKAELAQAKTVLDMHQIRSSVDGIIKAILKQPGESVKGTAG